MPLNELASVIRQGLRAVPDRGIRPLSTFAALHARGRDVARAELFHGGRHLTLELQGLSFGRMQALAA